MSENALQLRHRPTRSVKSRRISKFNDKWKEIFPWAERGSKAHWFRCITCNCELTCVQGRDSLAQHESTKKHKIQSLAGKLKKDSSMNEKNGCKKEIQENAEDFVKVQDNNSTCFEEKGSTSCLATCRIVEDKSDHVCAQCCMKSKVKYQLLHQQRIHYLCSDLCFQSFCDKQNLICVLESAKAAESPTDTCIVCEKIIQDGQGYCLSPEKKLCSEDCKQKYKKYEVPELCAQCGERIKEKAKCITWTSKLFCTEDCLDKYQMFHFHHCPNCQTVIEKASLGRFCLYTITDIQDFCSLQCLEVFKKDPKVCKICGNFIFGSKDALTTMGKALYCEKCIVIYDISLNSSPSSQHSDMTNVGLRIKQEDIQENDDDCSEFSATEALTEACYTCNKDIISKCRKNLVLQLKGASKRFCSKPCMNRFVLSDRKFPCFWCKDKKPVVNMVERVDSINHVQLFCSLNCLSLFRVSLNATSSKDVQCDNCHRTSPAQYHLTMSDASVRNFCSYECVLEFQNQFEDIPKITNATSI